MGPLCCFLPFSISNLKCYQQGLLFVFQAKGGSSDVGLEIGIFQLDGIKTKISVCTDPTSRPRFSHSLSLGLEFANIEDVGVQIKGYEAEKMTILRSVLLKQLEAHLKNQITSIILNLLDYYLSVGGVSQVPNAQN